MVNSILTTGEVVNLIPKEELIGMAMELRTIAMKSIPNFVDSAEDACSGADAVVLITEWSEFRNPDFRALKAVMRQPIIFDGRNVLVPEVVHEAGFEYHGLGRIPPA